MEYLGVFVEHFKEAPNLQLGLEFCLVFAVIWMLRRRKAPQPSRKSLTEEEKAEILAKFTPEPLCGTVPDTHYALNPRIVSGRVGARVTVNDQKDLINMATHNYLGLADRADSTERAIKALKIYGVGSCGPRGFYGTADVHLELEARLAQFMGVEEACLYSYGFSAISSAIPSYSKKHDVIFADEQVNFAIQQGITASRSTVYFFKHNSPEDLERLLQAQDERDRRNPKKAKTIRRFLILEGIYMNTGTLVDLPAMVKLRAKYMCRLFLDETISFGTMGKTGKGVREHFGVPNSEIDLMSATLEHSISSYGGFLCGSHFLMEHQRLCGLAYCFSASLPPLQAVVTLGHLSIISETPVIIEDLQRNCKKIHQAIVTSLGKSYRLDSHPLSPLKHLYLNKQGDKENLREVIDRIVLYAENNGVALCQARYIDEAELLEHEPSVKLAVSRLLTDEEIKKVVDVLAEGFKEAVL